MGEIAAGRHLRIPLIVNAMLFLLIFDADKSGMGEYVVRQEGSRTVILLAKWRKTKTCAGGPYILLIG